MIGTSMAAVTPLLATLSLMPGDSPAARMAFAAAIVGFGAYAVGFVGTFFLPEPVGESLPE